jgi:hypothetical protein
VALRAGDAVTGGGQGAFIVAFCLLALVAAGCAAEALRMDPAAGNAARRRREPQFSLYLTRLGAADLRHATC